MCKSDGGLIGFGAVNVFFVWNKVYSPPEYVSGLMTPFRVDGRIKALDVTPPGLAAILLVGLVTKRDSGDVFRSKKPLEGCGDCGL